VASPQVIELEVRNYECDIEGIVNNAVYLNYLEHARHEYIRSLGTDFLSLHNYGTDPVVARIEIDYRKPLVAGDRVRVESQAFRKGRYRILFDQRIVRTTDGVLAAEATVNVVFITNGRPVPAPAEFEGLETDQVRFEESAR